MKRRGRFTISASSMELLSPGIADDSAGGSIPTNAIEQGATPSSPTVVSGYVAPAIPHDPTANADVVTPGDGAVGHSVEHADEAPNDAAEHVGGATTDVSDSVANSGDSAVRAHDALDIGPSADDKIGVPIQWKPSGKSGSGTIIIDLPDGRFTDSLKIVSETARKKLLEKLGGRATPEALDDIREQLEESAGATAAQMSSGDDGANDKDANKLIELVLEDEGIELFHAPGDADCGYATVSIDGRQETFFIGGMAFKAWLSRRFFEEHRSAAGGQAMTDACQVLTGHALHAGPEIKVETRVAFCGDGIAVDLGDAERNVVMVTKDGWQVLPSYEVPVRFIRRNGCLPLPFPIEGGSIDMLRQYVNLPDDDSWVLVVGFMVACLYPRGPFPVLVISGEQGSAKSTLARMLQRLVDANKAELRRPPKNEEDLIIAASNTWLLAYDNLSGIRPELSDAICTLATGGGFAARRLFTNGEEVIFQAQRPVMLNGIDDLTRRADLLDRSIVLRLESIDESRRQPEDVLWAGFEEVAPEVLGALLDALVGVLQRRDMIHLDSSPRMADFAKTVCAAEEALGWEPRTFLLAYEQNRDLARALAIEESVVAREILRLMTNVPRWDGSATELRDALFGDSAHSHSSPERIGRELRRVAPSLRHVGVEVEWGARQPHPDRGRIIRLARTARWNSSRNGSAGDNRSSGEPLSGSPGPISGVGNGWNSWNGIPESLEMGENCAVDNAGAPPDGSGVRAPGQELVGFEDNGDTAPERAPVPPPDDDVETVTLAAAGVAVLGGEPRPDGELPGEPEDKQPVDQDGPPGESCVAERSAKNRSNRSKRSSEPLVSGTSARARACYACGGLRRWRLRDAGFGEPGEWVCERCHPPIKAEHLIERIDAAGGAA